MSWKVAIPVVLVLVVVWFLAKGFGTDPHAVPSVLEQRPAPTFNLQTLDGKTVSLESLRGKPVLVNFWASWCVPCNAEHQSLQAAARYYGDRAQFLGIVYQDSPENAAAYLQQHGNSLPQLLDPDTKTAIDYGVAGVPETFFIDKRGIIRQKVSTALTFTAIRQLMDPMVLEGVTP
jgi:cytochrome c biogenesis protein CcmG/thiol:disulfide interchange protein DsbE